MSKRSVAGAHDLVSVPRGHFVHNLDLEIWAPSWPVVAVRILPDGQVVPITPFGTPERWAWRLPNGALYDQAGRRFSSLIELFEADCDTAQVTLPGVSAEPHSTPGVDPIIADTAKMMGQLRRATHRRGQWGGLSLAASQMAAAPTRPNNTH